MMFSDPRFIAQTLSGLMTPPPPPKNYAALFLAWVAGILLCASIGALVFGAYLTLSEMYPPRKVFLILGGWTFLASVVMAVVAWTVGHFRALRKRVIEGLVLVRLNALADAVGDEFGDVIRTYPKTSMAVAGLAGLAVGHVVSGARREGASPDVVSAALAEWAAQRDLKDVKHTTKRKDA